MSKIQLWYPSEAKHCHPVEDIFDIHPVQRVVIQFKIIHSLEEHESIRIQHLLSLILIIRMWRSFTYHNFVQNLFLFFRFYCDFIFLWKKSFLIVIVTGYSLHKKTKNAINGNMWHYCPNEGSVPQRWGIESLSLAIEVTIIVKIRWKLLFELFCLKY